MISKPKDQSLKFWQKYWELAVLKISVFLSWPFRLFFASFPSKLGKNYGIEWMGLSFYDYWGFKPKHYLVRVIVLKMLARTLFTIAILSTDKTKFLYYLQLIFLIDSTVFNVFFLSCYRGISSQQQIIVHKMLARTYTRNSLKNTKTAIKQKRQQTSKMRR